MIDVLKAYVQVATGVGELTRQRAMEAARQALASSPAAGVLPAASAGVDGLTTQASALADELLEAGRQNRVLLRQLVTSEVEAVVARLGVGQQVAEVQAQLAAARSRVRELEQALAAATSGRVVTRRAQSETVAAALAPDADAAAEVSVDGAAAAGSDETADLDAPVLAARKVAAERAGQKAAETTTTNETEPTESIEPTAPTAPTEPTVPTAPESATTTPKKTADKSTEKKTAEKQTAAKKSAPKQTAAKQTTAKQTTAKKTAGKKATAKTAGRAPAKKTGSAGDRPTPATAMPQAAPSDAAQERAAALAAESGTT